MRERAEPDCSAPAVAEVVMQRAWLPPSAASLTALALHPTPATWLTLRDDPGAVLLLLRHPDDGSRPSFLLRMLDPAVLDEAVRSAGTARRRRCRLERPRRAADLRGRRRPGGPDPRSRRPGRRLRSGRGVGVRPARAAGVVRRLRCGPHRRGRLPGRPEIATKSLSDSAPVLGNGSGRAGPPSGPSLAPAGLADLRGRLPPPTAGAGPLFRPRSRPVALRANRRQTGRARGE